MYRAAGTGRCGRYESALFVIQGLYGAVDEIRQEVPDLRTSERRDIQGCFQVCERQQPVAGCKQRGYEMVRGSGRLRHGDLLTHKT